MPFITMACGAKVRVDKADYKAMSKYKWCMTSGYATRRGRVSDGSSAGKMVYMHRQLMDLWHGDRLCVDHVNGDRSDNRRENLRVCTHQENSRNKKRTVRHKTGLKGVREHRDRDGKVIGYAAQIRHCGATRYLGFSKDPELMHELYCLAADMLHGEFVNHGGK